MKKLFRSGRALSPWLSLAVPLFVFGSLFALSYMSPSLFCVPVNPGGKEFICGSRYSHFGIRLLRLAGLSVWVLLLIVGGAELFRGRATRPAVIAWSVSALLLVSSALLWLSLPVDDAP
jgi:hypothetical protein